MPIHPFDILNQLKIVINRLNYRCFIVRWQSVDAQKNFMKVMSALLSCCDLVREEQKTEHSML